MSKYTAKPFVFDSDKYRKDHQRLIAGVGGQVADVFSKTAKKIAKIGLSTGFNSDTEEFKWSDYPVQQKQAQKAVQGMLKDLVRTIEQAQVAGWDASNLKNDAMVKAILPTTDLPEDIVASFMPRNNEALKAFQERKVSGMTLSERIWSFEQQSTREFEMALDVALGTGKSAAALSRDIRLSLKEPNNLFRRVRDKHGNLVPSKAMQAHKVGRGVYHSSYKNALRVAATETNMAYRHADNTRWRGMGFVLGIEVSTSINNHNPHPDMCDDLAGVYPVDFEFVGWHPFCRCWAAPKLADRKEMEAYLDALQDGKDVSNYAFTGRVEDVPQGFTDWVESNKGRIENAANKPYFIRDNYVDGDPAKGFKFSKEQKEKAAQEAAEQDRKEWLARMQAAADARHAARTPEEVEAIKQRVRERQIEMNARELERLLGVERGAPMTWEQADLTHANPHYKPWTQWNYNCQTCVPAYELRRRGFNIIALGKYDGFEKLYKAGKVDYLNIFLNPDGSRIKRYWSWQWQYDKGYKVMTQKRIEEFYKEMLRHEGRYEIRCGWKGQKVGHVFCADVDKDGVIHWFDPQTGEHGEAMFKRYLKDMDGRMCYVIRTDNKIINPNMAGAFEKALNREESLKLAIGKAKTVEEVMELKKANADLLPIGSDLRKEWAQKRAELRYKERSFKETKAISDRIEQRKKDVAAFEKFKATAGANIKANAGQLAWFDANQLAELDKLANRPQAYRAKAKEMAQQIAAIRKDIKELEILIPDVQSQWSKQFTSEELHGVFDAVKKKISQIENAPLNTYKWTDHLQQEADKYKFEIYDYLGGNMGGVQQKYKTWKVSQAAYKKQLEAVEDKIWFNKAQEKITDLDALYNSHTSSAKLKKFVDDAMDAYMAGDKAKFAAKAQEAEAWADHLDKLTAQRNARNARKKAQAAGSPSTNTGTLGDLTDKEHAEAAQRLLEKRKKQGILTLSTKDVRKKWQEISEEAIKANPDRAKINRILAELGEDLENPYSQSRRDAAVWITGDPFDSYKELAPQTAKVWKAAPQSERTAIYQYTYEYCNINEPLRGLTYIGNPSKAARGITNIGEITNLLEKTNLEHDMWFQRGDGMISLKKFGLIDFSTASDKEIKALVGKEGVEGAFWSSGSAKGKGFGGDVIFNIYAPKGTKGMYVEPFSDFGKGSRSDKWKGDLTQKTVGRENEFLFQRGTKFKITKAEKNAGTWFIDIEVVEQNVLPFPYVGGYPFL